MLLLPAATFARDARILVDGGYKLTAVTPVDQFRYSAHVEIVARLDIADLCAPPEIAGPGFINLRLRDDWLETQTNQLAADERRLRAGAGVTF